MYSGRTMILVLPPIPQLFTVLHRSCNAADWPSSTANCATEANTGTPKVSSQHSITSPPLSCVRLTNSNSYCNRTWNGTQVTDVSFALPIMGQINFTQIFATSDTHAHTIHVRQALNTLGLEGLRWSLLGVVCYLRTNDAVHKRPLLFSVPKGLETVLA